MGQLARRWQLLEDEADHKSSRARKRTPLHELAPLHPKSEPLASGNSPSGGQPATKLGWLPVPELKPALHRHVVEPGEDSAPASQVVQLGWLPVVE